MDKNAFLNSLLCKKNAFFCPGQKCFFEFYSEVFLSTCLRLLVALFKMQLFSFPGKYFKKRITCSNLWNCSLGSKNHVYLSDDIRSKIIKVIETGVAFVKW